MACNCGKKKIVDKRVDERTYTLPKNLCECPYCGYLRTPEEMMVIEICDVCARKIKKEYRTPKVISKKQKVNY